MHTSTRLAGGDFRFFLDEEATPFATSFPDYHPQDRIGVVSLGLEDGVLHTSFALLAFTTAFYDHLRARQSSFFDYPQHFAFVGAPAQAGSHHGSTNSKVIHVGGDLLPADTPQLWNAWSWLDVWPANKWLTAPPTIEGMIQRVFDYQINRLFWPRALTPPAQGIDHNAPTNAQGESTMMGSGAMQESIPAAQPPSYVWKMLLTSLKAVYLYGPEGAGESPWRAIPGERIEVHTQTAAQEIVQESLVQLPAPLLMTGALDQAHYATAPQCYTRAPVAAFLSVLGGYWDLA